MIGIFIYLLAAFFLLYEMALQVSPSVMTQHLMLDFGGGAAALGVMASFYFYSYTLMQIPVGLLFDRFNARWLISGAVFLCALGTFFFGWADGIIWASAGRFLMGIGSAFAFVGVLVVAARWFPPKYFAFLVGVAQFLAAMGALCGELPLSWLLEELDWRMVMVLLGGLGVVLTCLCVGVIRDRPYQRHHHLLAELREIVRSSQTWWIALYAFCGWGPVAVFAALWGVPYMKVRFGVETAEAALAMALVWVGIGLTSPFLGWISDHLGRRKVLLTACSSVGLVCSLILFYLPVGFGTAFALLFGMGIAAGGQILSFALVKDNNRPSVVGTAVGLNNMAVVAGGALFQPLVGFLLQLYWGGGRDGYGAPVYSIENYHIGLVVVPLCFFVGVISSLFFIKETYCKPKYDPIT
ncbi:MFS transporter [Candidatus Neptunochlamydia vexilliferae]|uniref:MFS transporter n=1 Tax=Candidatus Neptunichlamydia vexilliferae TaxID=1651774 RepID=UPI0018912864|nr:MFS transporter [Candidatus Neptunochlamydia vexilliferae]